jgi:hypothetical protein
LSLKFLSWLRCVSSEKLIWKEFQRILTATR